MAGTTEAFVALLRGVNVGGKNKLPMKHLAALFEGAGAKDVRTYIQSGNVVFHASATRASAIASKVRAAIGKELGLRVPVVLRSGRELRAVLAANPFLRAGVPTERLHVFFLETKPTAAAVAALDPKRSAYDVFEVRGSEVFLFCPEGLGKSKLTNDYFDRTLKTVSTARNWRTVGTLVGMCESAPQAPKGAPKERAKVARSK